MPIVVSPKRKKKRKIGLNKKTYRWISFLFVVLIIKFYALFLAGLFDVNFIEHRGFSNVTEEEVDSVINDYLDQGHFLKKRSNLFLVDLDYIENKILEEIPRADDVQVTRKLFNGLLVDLSEKNSRGIYCLNSCYYFDQSGIAYEQAPRTEGFLVLNIQDEREREIDPGDLVLDSGILNSIYATRDLFKDSTEIDIRRFIIPSASFDEFWVETEENWLIYMVKDDPKRQVEDLSILLENNFSDRERKNLDYVDIRLNGRAYYKLKEI